MTKKAFYERVIEITLFQVMGVIIIGIADFAFDWVAFWVTWVSCTFFTIIIWQVLVRVILKNRERIPGRIFEFLFFLFLFVSSYAITFIAAFTSDPQKMIDSVVMYVVFIPSFISAVYCGWLYYVKGFCTLAK